LHPGKVGGGWLKTASGPTATHVGEVSSSLRNASPQVSGWEKPARRPELWWLPVLPHGQQKKLARVLRGPFPVDGKGFMFRGGSGGHGLSDAASDVRIMDPVTGGKHPLQNGYASYLNGGRQTINPFTGQTVGKSSPWWHWAFLP